MKNTILFLAIIALCISITSCRKERTCECKTTTTSVVSGPAPGAGTFVTNTDYKVTKAKQRKRDFLLSTDCFSESYVTYDTEGANSSTNTVDRKCDLN